MEKEINKKALHAFKSFIKRDFLYIVVCLVAILACFWTVYSVTDFQEQCNDHWLKQIDKMVCLDESVGQEFDGNLNLWPNLGGGLNEEKD